MDKRKGVKMFRGRFSRGGRGIGIPRNSLQPSTKLGRGKGDSKNLRRCAPSLTINSEHVMNDLQKQFSASQINDGIDLSRSEHVWNGKLPGYSYYFKHAPTLINFEEKVLAVESFLINSTSLLHHAPYFQIETWMSPVQNKSYYPIDADIVQQNVAFSKVWPSFMKDLNSDADEVINLWSSTVYKVIFNAVQSDEDRDEFGSSGLPNIAFVRVGFFRSSEVTPLTDIISSSIGHFVTIKGVVVRTGSMQPYISLMTFTCKLCEINFTVPQPGGNLTLPTRCVSKECSNKTLFETQDCASTTGVLNSRFIRIQDTLYNNVGLPKIVECLLLGNLVDECRSSDVVVLSGIVRLKAESDFLEVQGTHDMYVEVSAIKRPNQIDRTMGGHMLTFNSLDYDAINEIRNTPELFRFLVASVCPRILGHEMVKAGLLLSLFGGKHREGFISRRGDINILLIGDPGVGKSELLKVIGDISPRAIYVCGNGSTTAGLTVTLNREGNDFCVDAGALVLADKGIICIDELDKMSSQHHVMLEAMEQQRVTIAKAGVYRSLPARVSVFAAANPVNGHFDSTKTVSENTKISHPLLSRFDLIFVMFDNSNEELDRKVAEHILHINLKRGPTNATTLHSNVDSNLSERLKPLEGNSRNFLPHNSLRKYVAYARQYVHPEISSEAGDILKEYFLKMRSANGSFHSIPPTTRLLESLVRLTEARAKIELREVATVDDAKDVLELFEASLKSSFENKCNAVSALAGILKETKKRGGNSTANFLHCLQLYAQKENKRILDLSEMRKLGVAMGYEKNVDTLIGKLNWSGDLLKKGGDKYQLI